MNLWNRVLASATIILLVTFVFWSFHQYPDKFETSGGYQSKVDPGKIKINTRQSYSEIKKSGFQPKRRFDPWPFRLPIDWAANPFDDSNWQFQLHAWRAVDPIINRYIETGNPKYYKESIDYVRDWYQYHQDNSPGKHSWNDMAAGIRAMRIAFLLDEVFSGKVKVDPEVVRMLSSLADQHILKLMNEGFINKSNHGLFQISGLNLLCSVVGSEACEGELVYSRSMLKKIIDRAFTSEGVHKEHSPTYHLFTLNQFEKMDMGALLDDEIQDVLSRAKQVTPWLAWPSGKFVEAGDSVGKIKPLSGKTELTCMMGVTECYAIGDFTNSGYAVIRSNPDLIEQQSMLFMTGMSYSSTHKHVDELSFLLFEHGEMVFIDSGKYGYGVDQWRDYVISPSAHNTISMEDHVLGRESLSYEGSYLNEIEIAHSGFMISGEIDREGFFHQSRTLTYHPGESLTIEDNLSSSQERTYVSSLHLAKGLEPTLNENGFQVELHNGQLVRARLIDDDCKIEKVRGQENPVLGWESVGYKEMEPRTVVRALCVGTDRSIRWDVQL